MPAAPLFCLVGAKIANRHLKICAARKPSRARNPLKNPGIRSAQAIRLQKATGVADGFPPLIVFVRQEKETSSNRDRRENTQISPQTSLSRHLNRHFQKGDLL
jgi:hypothetical protein